MPILRIYLRVIGLLAPEKGLAITLALANLALAGVYFLEPWLFGRVVDALAAPGHRDAWRYIGMWAVVGSAASWRASGCRCMRTGSRTGAGSR